MKESRYAFSDKATTVKWLKNAIVKVVRTVRKAVGLARRATATLLEEQEVVISKEVITNGPPGGAMPKAVAIGVTMVTMVLNSSSASYLPLVRFISESLAIMGSQIWRRTEWKVTPSTA
jgi:hypothetical protein